MRKRVVEAEAAPISKTTPKRIIKSHIFSLLIIKIFYLNIKFMEQYRNLLLKSYIFLI